MLSSIFSSIYNYISKSRVDLHVNQPFSDVFFDKFKNLLDDYIVNYQIKYFFYLLFISFFYLELSEGLFQLLHNYSPYHLSISGSFIIDFCYSLFNIGIIDFIYFFFSFNLDIIGSFISLMGHNSYYTIIFMLGVVTSALAHEHDLVNRNNMYVQTAFIMYLMGTFILSIFCYFDLFSFNSIFYIILAIFAFSGFNIKEWNIHNSTALVISFILILLPYYMAFFIFLLALCFYLPIVGDPANIVISPFYSIGELILLILLTYYIFPLAYVNTSSILFVLSTFPFLVYLIYIYRNIPNDIYEVRDLRDDPRIY